MDSDHSQTREQRTVCVDRKSAKDVKPKKRFAVILPDFTKHSQTKAVLNRVSSGHLASKKTTRNELSAFMTVMADYAIQNAKMDGHVPTQYQQKLVRLFVSQYSHIVNSRFRGKDPAVVEKILVVKLSNKLTQLRKNFYIKAGVRADREQIRLKSLKQCRPGVRADCLNPPGKQGFTDEEEDFRLQLVERFQQFDFGDETWYLWKQSQEYRRMDVQSCVWQTDPKTGFLYRVGLDEIIERWPLLQHLVFLGADMDYLTDYEDSLNTATENYFAFMLRALLFYAKSNSGVNRFRSNAESMRRSGVEPVHFEFSYPVLMDLINGVWDGKHEIPTAANDVGAVLRFIPIYGVFQRFSFWPIQRVPAGKEVKPPEHGVAIVETKTGRKVEDVDVCTYSLYAEGVEISMPDHELMTAVTGSFAASYALHLPMLGQNLESLDNFKKLPNALQVLAKFLFQNEDGTGPMPEVFVNYSAFHPQAVSLYNIIRNVEENVNIRVVDLTEEDYDEENHLVEGDKTEDESESIRTTPLQEQNTPSHSNGGFKVPAAAAKHASRSECESRSTGKHRQRSPNQPTDVANEDAQGTTPTPSDLGLEVPSRRKVQSNRDSSSSARSLGTLVRTESPAASVMQRTPAVRKNTTPSSLSSASFENLSQDSSGSMGSKNRGPTVTSVAIRNTPIPSKNILIRKSLRKENVDSDEDLVTGEMDSARHRGDSGGYDDEACDAIPKPQKVQRKPVPRSDVPSRTAYRNEQGGSSTEPAKFKRIPVPRQVLPTEPKIPTNVEDDDRWEHIGEAKSRRAEIAPLEKPKRKPVPRIEKSPPQSEDSANENANEWEEPVEATQRDSPPPSVSKRANHPPPPPSKYARSVPEASGNKHDRKTLKKNPASESRKELKLKASAKVTRAKSKTRRRRSKNLPSSDDSDSDGGSYVPDESASPDFATPEESDGNESDGHFDKAEANAAAEERERELLDATTAQPEERRAAAPQIRLQYEREDPMETADPEQSDEHRDNPHTADCVDCDGAGKENKNPTSCRDSVTKLIPRAVHIKKNPQSSAPIGDGQRASFDSNTTTVPVTPPRRQTRHSLKRLSNAAQQNSADRVSHSQPNAKRVEIPPYHDDPLVDHFIGTLRSTQVGEEEAASSQSAISPYRRSPVKKVTRLTQ